MSDGIARLLKSVVNVSDLDEGLRFWSAVSGLEPSYVDPTGRFAGLGQHLVDGEASSLILLQLVPEGQGGTGSRTHLDFKVDDVELAVEQIVAVGGSCQKPPGLYPDGEPFLEWAVMCDPFGNEFCIIRSPL